MCSGFALSASNSCIISGANLTERASYMGASMTQPGHTIPAHGSPHAPPIHGAPHPSPMRPPVAPPSIRSGVVAAQTAPPTDRELEPLTLIEDRHPASPTPMTPPPPKKIQAFGEGLHVHKKHDWKRQTVKT